jgi:predicted RNase H-like HicB family nuclease
MAVNKLAMEDRLRKCIVVALVNRVNDSFDISFPDFPVVVATGVSVDQAIKNGRVILSLYIKSRVEAGLGIPRLRALEELREDPGFNNPGPFAVMVSLAIDCDNK